MANELAAVTCDACEQADDHPMIHVKGEWNKTERIKVIDPSFHFDCLPNEYVAELGVEAQHARTLATRAAALSGVHGDDLRTYIDTLPNDNNLDGDARFEPITEA